MISAETGGSNNEGFSPVDRINAIGPWLTFDCSATNVCFADDGRSLRASTPALNANARKRVAVLILNRENAHPCHLTGRDVVS